MSFLGHYHVSLAGEMFLVIQTLQVHTHMPLGYPSLGSLSHFESRGASLHFAPRSQSLLAGAQTLAISASSSYLPREVPSLLCKVWLYVFG